MTTRNIQPLFITVALLLWCSTLLAGSHVRSTTVTDGLFYPDASKGGVYHFESEYRTEHFDISGQAFLQASGLYPPEIPGLRGVDIRVVNGKLEIHEKDADQIQALADAHGAGIRIYRAADMGLFYVHITGKTRTRKITIESEQGDLVVLWRNLPE